MPITPGSPEWHGRVDELRAAEAIEPERWWYLSFCGENQFLGAAVVRARGMLGAIEQAHRLRINPGGQVRGMEVPAGRERYLPVNRLLSIADIEEGGPVPPRSP